jgi:hypothetical protein
MIGEVGQDSYAANAICENVVENDDQSHGVP